MLTSRFGALERNSNWNQHVHLLQAPRALPPDEPKKKLLRLVVVVRVAGVRLRTPVSRPSRRGPKTDPGHPGVRDRAAFLTSPKRQRVNFPGMHSLALRACKREEPRVPEGSVGADRKTAQHQNAPARGSP